MDRYIGFSTGACYKFLDSLSDDAVRLIKDIGCTAIEINWHDSEVPLPLAIAESLKENYFEKVSLHLPCNTNYGVNDKAHAIFTAALDLLSRYPFDYALFHPDLVTDWRVFKTGVSRFNTPISIENMDDRKKSFKDIESLYNFFSKNPHIRLVFDVNHWIVNGNGIISIPETLQRLEKREIIIKGIHLSGTGMHMPLHKDLNGQDILGSLSGLSKGIPIILESVCENADEMRKEFDFVHKFLR